MDSEYLKPTRAPFSGAPPFPSDTKSERLVQPRNICHGLYNFSDPVWNDVSENAKAVVRSLLTTKVDQRLTAEQTLAQPWLQTTRTGMTPRSGIGV